MATTERSPLVRATSPRANGAHSILNPRAASFTFQPGSAASFSPPPPAPPRQHVDPAPPSSRSTAPFDHAPINVTPAGAPTTASTTILVPTAPNTPQVPPAFASTSLIRTRSHSIASSVAADESIQSGSSSSSSSSCDVCPTRRAFRRAHYVQFVVSALLVFFAFVLLAWWKHEIRFAELMVGAAAWLAGESLKQVMFELLTWESKDSDGAPRPGTGLVLPTTVHTVVQELLRLGGIVLVVALLPEPNVVTPQGGMPIPPRKHRGPREPTRPPLPPLDELFFSALWFAMGWALVEIIWGSRDFWQRMHLYDDVLEDELAIVLDEESALDSSTEPSPDRQPVDYGTTSITSNGAPATGLDKGQDILGASAFDRVVEERLSRETEEAEIDARIRALERDEVEAQLGVPLYEIPVAVVVVWRIDSILLSTVATLVLSLPFRTSAPSLIAFPLWPTFAAVTLVHILLSMMWTLRVKHVGIPAISYTTLVILLFMLFAALAAWGALE